MLYVTGASGLLGKRVIERWNSDVTKISYRDKVPDIFKKHKNSCLLHLGWSSIPSTQDEDVLNRDVTTSEILFSKYFHSVSYWLLGNADIQLFWVVTDRSSERDKRNDFSSPHSLFNSL